MNIKQDFTWLPVVGAIIITALVLNRNVFMANNTNKSFNTEKAQNRFILSEIKAQGILLPEEIVHIGNLIDGMIRYLYAEENDLIEEGQRLAEIDDSLDDSAVNNTFGSLDAAQAVLKYQVEFLKRQEQLFERKQISLDSYQQAERDYQAAYGNVEQTKGAYETAKLIYNNKRIKSPVSGMIISKNVSVGQLVNNYSPASVLYTIAKNITSLKACIFLDTNALEILQTNLSASMTLEKYPHTEFIGTITDIMNIPHLYFLTDYPYAQVIPLIAKTNCNFAVALIDNRDLRLRPGMTFNAHITIAEKDNVLSVQNQACKISKPAIQKIAHELGYTYRPLDSKKIIETANNNAAKTVWILQRKTFIERAVTVGISDDEYTEITSGLDGSEEIICAFDQQELPQSAHSSMLKA